MEDKVSVGDADGLFSAAVWSPSSLAQSSVWQIMWDLSLIKPLIEKSKKRRSFMTHWRNNFLTCICLCIEINRFSNHLMWGWWWLSGRKKVLPAVASPSPSLWNAFPMKACLAFSTDGISAWKNTIISPATWKLNLILDSFTFLDFSIFVI